MTSRLSIYIDNNVWDFLHARSIDLASALPRDRFCLAITREAEFEIPAIPDSKVQLKAYIDSAIQKCGVKTDYIFGFYDESLPPDQQRYGGFDVGRWATEDELTYIQQQRTSLSNRTKSSKLRPTGLYVEEADRALAMRSVHSVVLTLDAKKGPINKAYQQGGKVVFLNDFDDSGLWGCQGFCVNGFSFKPVAPGLQTGWRSGSTLLSSPVLASSTSC